jgi:RNA-directed DNA polymerase
MSVGTKSIGAPTNLIEGWHDINWKCCHEEVKRLQARIVKAAQEGKWNRVKALQRLLTSSFSGKALAVKRVTENKGKKTPGVDGKTWSTPESKFDGIKGLRRRGYRAQALRRIYIPKAKGDGRRPLSIPTMADRACQALYLVALDPIAETLADHNSYGFRKGRSTADAIVQCHTVLCRKISARYILEADIQNCFGEISSEWMLKHIPMDKKILGQWLKAGYIEKEQWLPTEAGAPQGGLASPTIMNLTLNGLETLLQQRLRKRRGTKVNFVRYADDFIITGISKELLENEVKPVVTAFLAERGLKLSEKKTTVTHIKDGFDFLGVNIRKYGDKCLTKPSKDGFKRLIKKLHQEIKRHYGHNQINLIMDLNPIIRGWTYYYCHDASKQTFTKLQSELWKMSWVWAKRQHPKKGRRWIKDRYFHRIGNSNWVFAAKNLNKAGKENWVSLFNPSKVPIKRHVKINGAFNPYDPAWYEYHEKRKKLEISQTVLVDRKLLLILLKQQKGKCLMCEQNITAITGWNVHHKIPKASGGGDEVTNLVLLHPNCHRQHHAKTKSVTKPVRTNKCGLTKA